MNSIFQKNGLLRKISQSQKKSLSQSLISRRSPESQSVSTANTNKKSSLLQVQQLPISIVLIPAIVFGTLTSIAGASWPGVDKKNVAYFLLTGAMALPSLTLCLKQPQNRLYKYVAIIITGLSSAFLLIHMGLLNHISKDLDTKNIISTYTIVSFTGVFISSISLPLTAVFILHSQKLQRYIIYILGCALGAIIGQQLWFSIAHLLIGPTGTDLWSTSRTLIHGGTGIIFGTLLGALNLHNTTNNTFFATGPLERITQKLPGALPCSALLFVLITCVGGFRIYADVNNKDRFATKRFDEYFFALSNIRTAASAGLLYPALINDFKNAKTALLISTDFDPELHSLFKEMLPLLENQNLSGNISDAFRQSALKLNKHLINNDIPYFFEPHDIKNEWFATRFVLKFKIEQIRYYTVNSNESANATLTVPVVQNRRLDNIQYNTPFGGLSYQGLGTISLDRIEDTAKLLHKQYFGPFPKKDILKEPNPFDETRIKVNADIIKAYETIFKTSKNKEEKLTPVHMSTLLALQTEIHEARHASDAEEHIVPPIFKILQTGPLTQSAVAETRAHLTEIVDGPLGPHYAVAAIWNLVAGENTSANAYFFAGIAILEGLYGQKLRSPNVIEIRTQNGPIKTQMPLSQKYPGRLSYAKIIACYNNLRQHKPAELKTRARTLFKRYFKQPYQSIKPTTQN